MAQFDIDLAPDEAVEFDAAFSRFIRNQLSVLDYVGLKLTSFRPRPGMERRIVKMPDDELLHAFSREWKADPAS